jgi:IS1 family transposase/transposase-like protein
MAFVQVQCPDCHSADVVQYGKQANGTQRYRCDNPDGPRIIFLLQYRDNGRLPAVQQQIIDMTLNGSGVRDIVRVLRVSSAPVIDGLTKKAPAITQVHARLLPTLAPRQVDLILRQVEQAEMDEMWSVVGHKSQQRWWWHAIDHHTGQIFASVCGPRKDVTFLKLPEFLALFGITHVYTDGWGAYRRHLDPHPHTVGKQHTQKIERTHLTFRTRIKRLTRKTICVSRSVLRQDLAIGLFINRYAFGYAV